MIFPIFLPIRRNHGSYVPDFKGSIYWCYKFRKNNPKLIKERRIIIESIKRIIVEINGGHKPYCDENHCFCDHYFYCQYAECRDFDEFQLVVMKDIENISKLKNITEEESAIEVSKMIEVIKQEQIKKQIIKDNDKKSKLSLFKKCFGNMGS